MIIFGWGHTIQKDYGETYPMKCSRCNNTDYWRLFRIRVWFDLFFIPVFPYKSNHYLLCPICNSGFKLDYHNLELAKELNQITLSFLDKKMTNKQYIAKLGNYDKLLINTEEDLD